MDSEKSAATLEAARHCVEEAKREKSGCRECMIQRKAGETCALVFARELVGMAETMEKLQDEILDLRDGRDRLMAQMHITKRQQRRMYMILETLCRVAGYMMDEMYGERD